VCTTDSAHANPIAPNLLARRFALADHPAPTRAWVGDMTYIPTRSGWLYLVVLIDLATRGIVGWATSASMATVLPLMALQQAVARRQPAPGCARERASTRRHRSGYGETAPDGAPPSRAQRTPRASHHRLSWFYAKKSSSSLADQRFSSPC